MTTPDIFLSYNREDQATAQRFAEAFEAEGFTVWWDVTLRSGEAYDQVTEEALKTAKAVVVLWSQKSVVSRWVRAEATLADRNRTLVPARIEPCDLPIMFELTQTADLAHWKGETGDATWSAFLADVRRFIAAGAATASPASSVSSTSIPPLPSTRPSIAVLPFINRSGIEADDVFADGMVEDITAALSLSRRMKVIAASATAAYRTGVRDLHRIGQDLAVRYLLEGNVRRVGDDLRVTAQLVEAETSDIVWTRKFDRPLAELSALQEDLVTEVAACLGAEVQRAEMEHALRKPGDITAWEAVLRAEANISRRTASGAEAAIAEARRAIAIDPNYDLARATLALAQGLLFLMRGSNDAQLKQEVLENIERARVFDSSDAVVLARIASAIFCVGNAEEALPFAERAVAVNPNLETPHIALGRILLSLGRFEEAVCENEAAERLAPNGIWSTGALFWRAIAYLHAGQINHSLELTEQSLRMRPFVPAQVHRMICLANLDRWREARSAMRAVRGSNAELSFAILADYARHIGLGSDQLDDYVAILRRIWEETGGDA